jgi:hypothetical protein
MAYYYVDKESQPAGEHEIHRSDCLWLPGDRIFLGDCYSCSEALKLAKEYYDKVDGCRHCSIECNKRNRET